MVNAGLRNGSFINSRVNAGIFHSSIQH
jgi:hypothetical protein